MAELNVNIGNLPLKNPVMTASGTFGYGIEYADFMDISRLGGIFVKGTTIQPREGNDYPRMAETPSGMLNAVGLQNKGADYFAEHIYPEIKDINTNMIVNVSGSSAARAGGFRHFGTKCPEVQVPTQEPAGTGGGVQAPYGKAG